MASHNDLGKIGEEKAIDYLLKKDYTILEKNWTFQKAEIDIIAKKGEILAIIEVKTRSSLEFGLPQEFVNPKKIKLLVMATNEYVIKNDLDLNIRFDIIAIFKNNAILEIEHIEDAFLHF
jgi:putative endonuclease